MIGILMTRSDLNPKKAEEYLKTKGYDPKVYLKILEKLKLNQGSFC